MSIPQNILISSPYYIHVFLTLICVQESFREERRTKIGSIMPPTRTPSFSVRQMKCSDVGNPNTHDQGQQQRRLGSYNRRHARLVYSENRVDEDPSAPCPPYTEIVPKILEGAPTIAGVWRFIERLDVLSCTSPNYLREAGQNMINNRTPLQSRVLLCTEPHALLGIVHKRS